jgi:hypothetical protein
MENNPELGLSRKSLTAGASRSQPPPDAGTTSQKSWSDARPSSPGSGLRRARPQVRGRSATPRAVRDARFQRHLRYGG